METIGEARRIRSETAMRSGGYVVAPDLPLLAEGTRRTPDEVLARARCLAACASKAIGRDEGPVAPAGCTPDEASFLSASRFDEEDGTAHGWGMEACVALLWSLAAIEDMPPTDTACDHGTAFVALATLDEANPPTPRSDDDLMDMADLAMVMDAVVTHAEEAGGDTSGIDPDVARQRARALAWAVGGEWRRP